MKPSKFERAREAHAKSISDCQVSSSTGRKLYEAEKELAERLRIEEYDENVDRENRRRLIIYNCVHERDLKTWLCAGAKISIEEFDARLQISRRNKF